MTSITDPVLGGGPQPALPIVRRPVPGWLGAGTICRIEQVTVPGHRDGSAGPRPRDVGPVAATIAAWHRHLSCGQPLVSVWHRTAPGVPLQILASTEAASAAPLAPLLFPPGCHGRPVEADAIGRDLSAFPSWVRLHLNADVLALDGPGPTDGGLNLEQVLLSGWPGAFAVLLLAQPLPPEQIQARAEQVAAAERDALSRGSSPAYQVRAERLRAQHRLLQAGTGTGLWSVYLLAGAADAGGAATVAGLLTAGTDLAGTAYTLTPGPAAVGLEQALGAEAETPGGFPVASATLARLVRPPATEVPGVRVVEPSAFDVTPEILLQPGDLVLGEVLDADREPAGQLGLSPAALTRHTFVVGTTGGGKSQTVRALLEQASRANLPLPWLVIEPAKSEYARMAGRLQGVADVLVIRPGDPETIPACLNPLQPEPGFPLQTHIDLVRALFLAAFDAVEPFPQVLAHALTRCYRQAGFDLALGEPTDARLGAAWPTLADLQRTAMQVVAEIGYGREVTDNVAGFIDVRLGSLRLGTAGRFFEGGHPLDFAELMRRNVVLELEDVGSDQDVAFLTGAILLRLAEYLRVHRGAGPAELRHLTVIEEAHRLLRRPAPDSPAAYAVETIAALLAEVRSSGEGLIIADQIPTKVLPDVPKNTTTKIAHRLPASDDREAVGAAMNLTDAQSRQLVSLPPGQAAVFTDGMDAPLLIAVPLGEDREDAGPARRDPPVGVRTSTCGTQCRTQPCTLREITYGARMAADPHLVLWIELLTVAHLVGEPEPAPDRAWLHDLLDHPQRTLECAISERIQAAVGARRSGLAAHYDPAALADHLNAAAWRRLSGADGQEGCDGSETVWQAGRYRWIDVHRALNAATDLAQPHPDTDTWRARGLYLPGATIAEQQRAYRNHPDNHLPPRTVITGTDTPPVYQTATAALHPDPDPAVRLRHTVGFLNLRSLWPVSRLYPDAAPTAAAPTA